MPHSPTRWLCARMASLVLACLALLPGVAAASDSPLVTIIIVRHPETDLTQVDKPIVPLSAVGRARAALLPATLKDVRFTHMFASHTTRARETIADVAAVHKLPVTQLPAPGSSIDGRPVTDQTSRRAAIEPVAAALAALPRGSVALVGLNSENIYAILNRLGVPVAAAGQACAPGSMCVPCTSNECFPRNEFDSVWYLVRDPDKTEPVALLQFRYGVGWTPPR